MCPAVTEERVAFRKAHHLWEQLMTFKINFIKEVKRSKERSWCLFLAQLPGRGGTAPVWVCTGWDALGALKDVPPAPGGAGVLYL